jgi:hypothetical protein
MARNCQIAFRRNALNDRFLPKMTTDEGSNKVGEHQGVQMDTDERTNSSDLKEIREVTIVFEDSRADNLILVEELVGLLGGCWTYCFY